MVHSSDRKLSELFISAVVLVIRGTPEPADQKVYNSFFFSTDPRIPRTHFVRLATWVSSRSWYPQNLMFLIFFLLGRNWHHGLTVPPGWFLMVFQFFIIIMQLNSNFLAALSNTGTLGCSKFGGRAPPVTCQIWSVTGGRARPNLLQPRVGGYQCNRVAEHRLCI